MALELPGSLPSPSHSFHRVLPARLSRVPLEDTFKAALNAELEGIPMVAPHNALNIAQLPVLLIQFNPTEMHQKLSG